MEKKEADETSLEVDTAMKMKDLSITNHSFSSL
jgi:hypothetical protein